MHVHVHMFFMRKLNLRQCHKQLIHGHNKQAKGNGKATNQW